MRSLISAALSLLIAVSTHVASTVVIVVIVCTSRLTWKYIALLLQQLL